jgi:hypothetical protein
MEPVGRISQRGARSRDPLANPPYALHIYLIATGDTVEPVPP